MNLDYLGSPRFQEFNRYFVLSFENKAGRRRHAEYYLDPRVIQQINFTRNLERDNDGNKTSKFFTLEEVKGTILDFLRVTLKKL